MFVFVFCNTIRLVLVLSDSKLLSSDVGIACHDSVPSAGGEFGSLFKIVLLFYAMYNSCNVSTTA